MQEYMQKLFAFYHAKKASVPHGLAILFGAMAIFGIGLFIYLNYAD